jgi:acid phosphatase (class A)
LIEPGQKLGSFLYTGKIKPIIYFVIVTAMEKIHTTQTKHFTQYIVLLLSIFVLLNIVLFFVKNANEERVARQVAAYEDSLTFSNTQTWDPALYQKSKLSPLFTLEQLNSLSLTQFPANSSTETKKELEYLHTLVAERTPEKVTEIQNEVFLFKTVFGTSSLEIFINEKERPLTFELMQKLHTLLDNPLFFKKAEHNRVRPSYLDPTLTTAIPVPSHPAYPSGHSTQVHVIAHILGEFVPQHRTLYFESAERVAHNREIAGLHYPSDSKAGKLLAEQLVVLLLSNPDFLSMFNQAKSEWN